MEREPVRLKNKQDSKVEPFVVLDLPVDIAVEGPIL
jgi:hypothetical protein